MGIEGGRFDSRGSCEDLQSGKCHNRESGSLGQALGGADANADPGEAARPVYYDNAAEIAKTNSLPCKKVFEGGDEGGGVSAAGKFYLGGGLGGDSCETGQGCRSRWSAGIDSEK